MAHARTPTEIAKFSTQFEAEAVAAVVRDAGVDAAIFGDGGAFAGGLGAFGQWAVMVPAADAEEARRVILEARGDAAEAPVFAECPGCGYSLSGIEKTDRCPECGHDMEVAREDAKVRNLVPARQAQTPAWAWKVLWAGLAACAAIGVLTLVASDLRSIVGPLWVPSVWVTGFVVIAAGLVVAKNVRQRTRDRRSRSS